MAGQVQQQQPPGNIHGSTRGSVDGSFMGVKPMLQFMGPNSKISADEYTYYFARRNFKVSNFNFGDYFEGNPQRAVVPKSNKNQFMIPKLLSGTLYN